MIYYDLRHGLSRKDDMDQLNTTFGNKARPLATI